MTTNTSGSTPIGVSAVPTLPAPEVEGVGPDGVVPAPLIATGLTIWLRQLWPNSAELGDIDYVVFVWAPKGAAPYKLPPIPLHGPISLPRTVDIPASYLQKNEVVDLSYEVHPLTPDSLVYEYSSTTTLTFDTIAPGANGDLSAPESVLDPITDADLTALPTIDFRVLGDYWGRAPGDTVLFWISALNAVPTGLPIHKQTFTSGSGEMIVNVSVAEIIKLAASPKLYLFYKVMDKSLNTSHQFSLVGQVELLAVPPPTGLSAPDVPAYTARGLINREAARGTVVVRVNYNGFMTGDRCAVTWGKLTLPEVTVTSLPLSVPLDWRALIANGADTQRNSNLRVTYTIFRSGATSGVTSPPTLIDEDQRVAAIENPLAPALVNRSLDTVSIFGAVSNKANYLDSKDSNQGVRASFKLFKNPKVGERALLFWPGRTAPVTTYTVKPGDVEGMVKDFDFPIPWQAILDAGSNANTFIYWVSDNGVNQQQSPNTTVIVNLVPLIRFPRPTFPESLQHPNRFLNCSTKPEIWTGIQVLINPAPQVLQAGDTLLVTWQGFKNYPDRNPIPETFEVFTVVWAGAATQTFVVTNYEKLIRPLNDFSGGAAKYQVLRNNVVIGDSAVAYVQIDRKYSGSGFFCGPGGIGPQEK